MASPALNRPHASTQVLIRPSNNPIEGRPPAAGTVAAAPGSLQYGMNQLSFLKSLLSTAPHLDDTSRRMFECRINALEQGGMNAANILSEGNAPDPHGIRRAMAEELYDLTGAILGYKVQEKSKTPNEAIQYFQPDYDKMIKTMKDNPEVGAFIRDQLAGPKPLPKTYKELMQSIYTDAAKSIPNEAVRLQTLRFVSAQILQPYRPDLLASYTTPPDHANATDMGEYLTRLQKSMHIDAQGIYQKAEADLEATQEAQRMAEEAQRLAVVPPPPPPPPPAPSA